MSSLLCAAWPMQAACAVEAAGAPAALVHEGSRVRIPPQSPYRSRVRVDVVRLEQGTRKVLVPGVIEADPTRTVNVLAPLTGRITELRVRLGEPVVSGQVLARLQSADVLQAGTDFAKARDTFDLAERSCARVREVNAAGGNAQKDVEAAESALIQARADLDRTRARLKSLGIAEGTAADQLSLPLLAPAAGTVTAVNLGVGAVVNDLLAPVLTVANLDQVFITAQVPERFLSQVQLGQALTAVTAAWPDRPLHGTVSSIASTLDATSRRTAVRAKVANPGGWLRPNMFASIELAISQPAQPVVPLSALVMSNDRVLVFVEVQPSVYEARTIELGIEADDHVRVRSGLKGGERVVVSGGVLLND